MTTISAAATVLAELELFTFLEEEMDEKNPLHFNSHNSCPSVINKSGRPTNKNLIKFGPQPKSLVSQMLKKIKDDCSDSPILLNAINRSQEKSIEIKNCDSHSSSFKIILEPDPDLTKVKNNYKDTKIKIYSCDFPDCKYACKLSSNLIKHKRTHTSEKPYLCHLCSFRSNFINSLKVHQRTHTAERPYGCNFCSYRCNSSSNLKKHCKHRHSIISTEGQKPEPLNDIIDSKTELSASD